MSPLESDYVLRMITLLAGFLARLLPLRSSGDVPLAEQEIDHACRSLLGFDRNFLLRFAPAQLNEFFGSDPDVVHTRQYVAGVLLLEEAGLRRMQGDGAGCKDVSVHSLGFLLDALKAVGKPLDASHIGYIEGLLDELRGVDLPFEMGERTLWYYEYSSRFGKAEDVLFDMLERGADVEGAGVSFYERLGKKSDAELAQGDLPREEVEEGTRQLKLRSAARRSAGPGGG